MTCNVCDSKIDQSARVCQKCGARLPWHYTALVLMWIGIAGMLASGYVFISSFLAAFGIFGSGGDGDVKILAIVSVIGGTFSAILAMVAWGVRR